MHLIMNYLEEKKFFFFLSKPFVNIVVYKNFIRYIYMYSNFFKLEIHLFLKYVFQC